MLECLDRRVVGDGEDPSDYMRAFEEHNRHVLEEGKCSP